MNENYQNNSSNQLHSSNSEESSFQLPDLIALVWNNKWYYLICVTICLAIAIFFIYRTQPTYQRSMKVLLDETTQQNALGSLGVLPESGFILGSNASVANETEAFLSPDLMQTVVQRLGLETRYYQKQPLRTRELYHNNPVEMKLAGDNPVSGFSFSVKLIKDGKLELSDFHFGRERKKVHVTVAASLKDTVDTPVGRLIFYPTESFEDNYSKPLRISWNRSMTMAKYYCHNLTIGKVGKESTVLNMSMKDFFPGRASAILKSLVDVYN